MVAHIPPARGGPIGPLGGANINVSNIPIMHNSIIICCTRYFNNYVFNAYLHHESLVFPWLAQKSFLVKIQPTRRVICNNMNSVVTALFYCGILLPNGQFHAMQCTFFFFFFFVCFYLVESVFYSQPTGKPGFISLLFLHLRVLTTSAH